MGTEVLLTQAQENITTIATLYQRDLKATAVSDDLLYAVRTAISDMHSALDWTAQTIADRYGKGSHPYFPIVTDPLAFPARFDKELPLVATAAPDVRDAFERAQPYHTGNEALGHLQALSRVNKHRDFTLQNREESSYAELRFGGMTLMTLGLHGITVGGGPSEIDGFPDEVRAIGNEQAQAVSATIVDWRFADTGTSVLGTLRALHRTVSAAVADICQAAGL